MSGRASERSVARASAASAAAATDRLMSVALFTISNNKHLVSTLTTLVDLCQPIMFYPNHIKINLLPFIIYGLATFAIAITR